MFEFANQWTERHLSSCKSYRVNNHFRRRMKKWEDSYSRVFGCKANPELECGCYAEDEEIAIENNKCILDLGTAPDVTGTWSFTFETKIDSKSDKKLLNDKILSIMSGIGVRNWKKLELLT